MTAGISVFNSLTPVFGNPTSTFYHLGGTSPIAIPKPLTLSPNLILNDTPSAVIDDTEEPFSEWNTEIKTVVTLIALALAPVILLAVAIAMIIQKVFFGHSIADFLARTLVLPALTLNSEKLDEYRSNVPDRYIIKVTTEDNVELEGILIPPPDHDTISKSDNLLPSNSLSSDDICVTENESSSTCTNSAVASSPARQKWSVYFHGNNGTYEKTFHLMQERARTTGTGLISINYRGVGRSKGHCSSSKEILLDGRAVINYLLSQGVLEEDILIYGYSLGGGVASAVASMFPDVSLVVDRSFESVPKVANAFIWIPFYRELISWAVDQYWELDSYVTMQKVKGIKRLIVAHQDPIIGFKEASLYSAFIRNGQTPPPTLHLHYDIDPNRCICDRAIDYALTHYYAIPSDLFIDLIQPWLDGIAEDDEKVQSDN